MRTHRELERLIGTAIIEEEFRSNLLKSPETAASSFALSPEELDALISAGAGSLEELAAHLYAWITRAPKPKRQPATRWIPEGHQTARVAV